MTGRALGSLVTKRLTAFGYTVVELIVALTLGVLVLTAAIAFLITQIRTLEGSYIREDLARNSRYIGVSLRRDIQRVGIEIESTASFGTVGVWPGVVGDTLVILHVPYLPDVAPAHVIDPPPGNDNPLPPGGTCGSLCIDVAKANGAPLDLMATNLARLQVGGARRLIIIESMTTTSDTSVAIRFTADSLILRQPAGLSGGLRLDRFATYVQKLTPIIYYLDGDRLVRAMQLNIDGSPAGDVLAYGVAEFDVKLIFADGDEQEVANPIDSDDSNDYDDIVGVKVRVTVKADRVDPRINQGQLLRKSNEWVVFPRNLRYEKNRP